MRIFPDEDGNAQLACRNDGFLGAVRAVVYALGLIPCPGVGDWGSVGAWETHHYRLDYRDDGELVSRARARSGSRVRDRRVVPHHRYLPVPMR